MTGAPHIRLGFIALNDCAPLVVAQQLGLFHAEGLQVDLAREASWSNIRDKVAVGALDGGHMLGALPLACTLGLGGPAADVITPLSLNLNGAAITVSTELREQLERADPEGMARKPHTARPFKRLIEQRRAQGAPSLVLAVVFPFSSHNYMLRYWLAQSGVDPDKDLRIVVAPPRRMSELLQSGTVDGFCVGEPWGGLSVAQGVGEILVGACEVWRAMPDKVLGVGAGWAVQNGEALRALLRALLQATAWLDQEENSEEAAALLSRPEYVDAPAELIRRSLQGGPAYVPGGPPGADRDFITFHRHAASFPWVSQAKWFLTQMLRWGQIAEAISIPAVARQVYRPDLYRLAAGDLGISAPLADEKIEGDHAVPWNADGDHGPIEMGADRFFDGRFFDPAHPVDYLSSLQIGRVRPSLEALEAAAQAGI